MSTTQINAALDEEEEKIPGEIEDIIEQLLTGLKGLLSIFSIIITSRRL